MDQLVEIIKARCHSQHSPYQHLERHQVLGTPTREELMAMNPNYTESLGAWVGGPKGLVETTRKHALVLEHTLAI